MLTKILAPLRLALLAFGLLMALLFVLIAILIPIRIKGAKLSSWTLIFLGRYFFWVCNVKFSCTNQELLRSHAGFLFANHSSYADIPALISAVPGRFVTAIEVRQRPVLGWVAAGIGCIFIDRADKSRGRTVSNQIATTIQAEPFPPVIIYPEGKLGPGNSVLNFQRGGFRIASAYKIPYLLCAIRYNRPDVFTWHGAAGEGMVQAIWRLLQCPDPLSVELVPVEAVYPTPNDNPVTLAQEARLKISQALGFDDTAI